MSTSPSRRECLGRDEADVLRALRSQFSIPEGVVYLDGNSLGVLPVTAVERVGKTLTHDWGVGLVRSWNDAGWMGLPAQVGAKIARLIGAEHDEVVAADSTSVNLFKVLAAALRIAADNDPSRTTIVSERSNFPTDLYVAQGLIELVNATGGLHYRLRLVDSAAELDAAIDGECAILMLTEVDYRTGALHDMRQLTARAHAQGALVIWDLAHSAGALPVDLRGAHADFAVGCGYKYLNGGPGAPAFVYVAKRHQDRFWQPLSGWIGHAAPFEFEAQYRPGSGIDRYLCGTPPILSMVALDAGLDSVLAALPLGGLPALRAKSIALADLFIELVESHCAEADLELITPRAGARRGSQVSFAAPPALGGGYALMQALIARGVIGDFRAPAVLRFGFTPLYTRFVDVWDAVDTLRTIVADRSWDRPQFHARAAVT